MRWVCNVPLTLILTWWGRKFKCEVRGHFFIWAAKKMAVGLLANPSGKIGNGNLRGEEFVSHTRKKKKEGEGS